MLMYLLAVFFSRADSLSTLEDSSRAVESASLHQPHSVSAGDCPDQAGFTADWHGKLSLTVSIP